MVSAQRDSYYRCLPSPTDLIVMLSLIISPLPTHVSYLEFLFFLFLRIFFPPLSLGIFYTSLTKLLLCSTFGGFWIQRSDP